MSSCAPDPGSGLLQIDAELRALFHRLNNQLGIILAHAEMLETKAGDDLHRAKAARIVAGALDAMRTARLLRQRGDEPAR